MNHDFTTAFLVDQTPEEAFAAIKNVRGWWSEGLEGRTEELGNEFRYRHTDLHDSTQKLVESVGAQKVVWLVVDASLRSSKPHDEWRGTHLRFDISKKRGKTEVRFTHEGLTRALECFDACAKGWSFYVGESLRDLIVHGKGQPDPEARRPS